MYEIVFDRQAENSFKKLDRNTQIKISKKINQLKKNPYLGKRLSGNLHGFRSLRFDKYRIIYTIIEGKLLIVVADIAHRKGSYKL